ncbi:MAG: PLP-dependent aspartate aminotransferase family protein [Cytophagales bacterium]|nr:PLP-dependent aspartate aminotransferase family protein [Cytophagales bacterium]
MKFATKAVHAGARPDPATGALTTPLYQTSTYVQESPGVNKGYAYARGQNPTREALEDGISLLENGKNGLCFASGVAAIDAILRLLKPGDEIVTTTDLYAGSYRLFTEIFVPAGIKFRFVSFEDPEKLKEIISDTTKLVWLETPTNPMMNIIDIAGIAKTAKSHETLVAVDNTFATPFLQRPLDLGADIVMHSATKYLGGHSDLIMGAVVVNDDTLYQKLKFIQNTCGAVPGPNDCFLTHRGIKTLHLRMERNCWNAMKIARFLSRHSRVDQVNYPGLESHSGHELAKKQMSAFGAVLSFDLKDDRTETAIEIMRKMQCFTLAESLGGVESLVGHPATMSHGAMPREERLAIGIKDSLIRLSVGVEDADDLIYDLEQALD